eukprot:gnl/MRDRNA2_/MRDRNA2_75060_c0_seq1.p1 gnl/MRDRNA2_/MRDRNA2_75060_c0~~gnl/MRDRNA2_/MRDRNA2_75060_c0_seq1.p1  ORF type:complete len:785 (+),score=42.50 gnl/MRDRNA2_/MRDRNA2_75060_c0_seq1:118-2472(+)
MRAQLDRLSHLKSARPLRSYCYLVFLIASFACGFLVPLIVWSSTFDFVPGQKVINSEELCDWPAEVELPSCKSLPTVAGVSTPGSPCLLGQWSVIDSQGSILGPLQVQFREESGIPGIYMIALFKNIVDHQGLPDIVGYVGAPQRNSEQKSVALSSKQLPMWRIHIDMPFGIHLANVSEDQTIVMLPGGMRWVRGPVPCFIGDWRVLTPHKSDLGGLTFARTSTFSRTSNPYQFNVSFQEHTGTLEILIMPAEPLQWGIVVQWPATSPWFGTYVGNISADRGRVSFYDGAAWVRFDRVLSNGLNLKENSISLMRKQHECATEYLETHPGHLGPEGCIPCNCTARIEGRPEAYQLVVRNNFIAVLVLVLLAIAIVPLVGGGRPAHPDNSLPAAKAEFLPALHFIRFIGAVHIIRFHYWFRDNGSEWGFTWVSWYFMVSGFVLTRSRPPFAEEYCWRQFGTWLLSRWASAWPLHVLVLVLVEWRFGVGSGKWMLQSQCPVVWIFPQTVLGLFLENVFFCNSWMSCGDRGSWNHVNWFLATLSAYWLAFPFLIRVTRRFQSRWQIYCMLGICWFWSTLGHVNFYWYALSPFNNLDNESVILSQVRYTHPTAHIHTFMAGMLLANLHALESKTPNNQNGRWSCLPVLQVLCEGLQKLRCTLSLSGLFTLFYWCTPWRFYLIWWNGGLIPLHALLIIGLSTREDVLTRLFGHWSFALLGRWAYAAYITQVAAIFAKNDIFQCLYAERIITEDQYWYAPLAFAICTALGHYFVERPGIWLHQIVAAKKSR